MYRKELNLYFDPGIILDISLRVLAWRSHVGGIEDLPGNDYFSLQIPPDWVPAEQVDVDCHQTEVSKQSQQDEKSNQLHFFLTTICDGREHNNYNAVVNMYIAVSSTLKNVIFFYKHFPTI